MPDNSRLHEIRDSLKNYQWLENESLRLRKTIQQLQDEHQIAINQEGNGNVSNSLKSMRRSRGQANEHISVQSNIRRLINREKQINRILEGIHSIAEYAVTLRERAAIECRLDGMSVKEIAEHLLVSDRQVYRLINFVIERYLSEVESRKSEESK